MNKLFGRSALLVVGALLAVGTSNVVRAEAPPSPLSLTMKALGKDFKAIAGFLADGALTAQEEADTLALLPEMKGFAKTAETQPLPEFAGNADAMKEFVGLFESLIDQFALMEQHVGQHDTASAIQDFTKAGEIKKEGHKHFMPPQD